MAVMLKGSTLPAAATWLAVNEKKVLWGFIWGLIDSQGGRKVEQEPQGHATSHGVRHYLRTCRYPDCVTVSGRTRRRLCGDEPLQQHTKGSQADITTQKGTQIRH
jgi:hypothetical protein